MHGLAQEQRQWVDELGWHGYGEGNGLNYPREDDGGRQHPDLHADAQPDEPKRSMRR